MTIGLLLLAWILIGVLVLLHAEDGWLIMITDKQNVRNTWMAYPALFMTWLLWPLVRFVPRWIFIFMWRFGL